MKPFTVTVEIYFQPSGDHYKLNLTFSSHPSYAQLYTMVKASVIGDYEWNWVILTMNGETDPLKFQFR